MKKNKKVFFKKILDSDFMLIGFGLFIFSLIIILGKLENESNYKNYCAYNIDCKDLKSNDI